jgi:hypothetical protein
MAPRLRPFWLAWLAPPLHVAVGHYGIDGVVAHAILKRGNFSTAPLKNSRVTLNLRGLPKNSRFPISAFDFTFTEA